MPSESKSRRRRPKNVTDPRTVYLSKSIKPEFIYLGFANRHGLITSATGTGKTVTLQGLAEGFSDQCVCVFCADVKSDLAGFAEAGESKPRIEARDKEIGYKNEFKGYSVIFWDWFGARGHPIRTTIFEMGPLKELQHALGGPGGNPDDRELDQAWYAG